MTNQTNLDLLFQVTKPTDRSNGAATSNDRRNHFGDHLFQASTPPVASRGTNETRFTETARTNPIRSTPSASTRPSGDDTSSAGSAPSDLPVNESANRDTDVNVASAQDSPSSTSDVADKSDDGENASQDHADPVALPAIVDGQANQHSDAVDADAIGASEDLAGTEETRSEGGNKFAGRAYSSSRRTEVASSVDSPSAGSRQDDPAMETSLAVTADANVHDVGEETRHSAATERSTTAAGKDPRDANRTEQRLSTDSGGEHSFETGQISAKAAATKASSSSLSADEMTQAKTKQGERHDSDAPVERRPDASVGQANPPASEVIAIQATQALSATGNSDSATEAGRWAAKPLGTNGGPAPTLVRSARGIGKLGPRAAGGQADELPRVDAARFVGRVAKAVQVAHERGGSLQLRLSPPELGSLRLELNVQNGVMTANLEAETPAARQVLLDHLPALRDRLAEQNIRVERFDVDVRQEQQGGGADPRASQDQERRHQSHQFAQQRAAGADMSEPIADDAPITRSRLSTSGINVLA